MTKRHITWRVFGTFVLTVLTLYPNPRLACEQFHSYLYGTARLIDPQCPGLVPYEAEVNALVKKGTPVSAAVEKVVLARIHYVSDFQNWGMLDYWPTTAEAVARGKEDCDGIAIVTASLARRMGVPCTIRSRIDHMWTEFTPPAAEQPLHVAFMAAQTVQANTVPEFFEYVFQEGGSLQLVAFPAGVFLLWFPWFRRKEFKISAVPVLKVQHLLLKRYAQQKIPLSKKPGFISLLPLLSK
jgi:hypothetical protein